MSVKITKQNNWSQIVRSLVVSNVGCESGDPSSIPTIGL